MQLNGKFYYVYFNFINKFPFIKTYANDDFYR